MTARPRLRRTGVRATCRFCSRALPRPQKREHSLTTLLPGGSCSCGARYVIDPTGRNGGIALIEALIDANDGDRDRALFLERHKDYEDYIENYEPRSHTFITGFRGYRRGMARIYLVRMLDRDQDGPGAPKPGA